MSPGHQGNPQEAKAGESGFRQAEAKSGDHGENPLVGIELAERVHAVALVAADQRRIKGRCETHLKDRRLSQPPYKSVALNNWRAALRRRRGGGETAPLIEAVLASFRPILA